MKSVGIDLHKNTIVLCVVNQDRKILHRQTFLCADTQKVRDFFAGLGSFQAVVEATASYDWLFDLLEPLGGRLLLAHPAKLRLIAESANKSDKLDARILAEFLALGLIPQAYRPTKRQRQHRVLVRWRVAARRRQAGLKVQIRRVLANYNADRRDLFSLGRDYCDTVALSDADRFVLGQLWAALDFAGEQLQAAQKQLRLFAKKAPAVEQEARQILRSAPGVGAVVSEVVLAELGDWQRFGSLKKVASYAGLAPGQRESAGKRQELGISKRGSRLLRWVLVEAAWHAVRVSLKWAAVYQKLKQRRGGKKAIVAVARRLLCVLVSMLRSGQSYRLGPKEKAQGPKAAAGV